MVLASWPPMAAAAAADVYPDFDAVGGRSTLMSIVGALLTITLIVAVLMLVVCAVVWAVSAAHGNHQSATRGRIGVLVSLGAAVFAGGGVAWMNWLLNLGSTL